MTNSDSQSSTADTLSYWRSLPTSELKSKLSGLPKPQARAILTELMKPEPEDPDRKAGTDHRDRNLANMRRVTRAAQDISPLPPPPAGKWADLRAECRGLRRHLEICYPAAFFLPWGPDHLRLIDQIERAAIQGLLKCLAMPRGSGKTTIVSRSALWAILECYRRFVVMVGGTDTKAVRLLDSLKVEIQTNEMLALLYPQELHALRCLEGQSMRAKGQHFRNQTTRVEWRTDRVNFGYVPGVLTNGAILASCGLTGDIRGQQVTGVGGEVLRPDMVLPDDPQTKESAASEEQCEKRHQLMMGDLLGMAGPKRSISAVTTCTVIYSGDLADRLLDRQLSPDWQGDKCKLVYKWPKNSELWDKYSSLRAEELAGGGDGSEATSFYAERREEMDAGAEVGWPERFDEGTLSAIQTAYNLKLRDENAFWTEYQNEPIGNNSPMAFELDPVQIARRTTDLERQEVPSGAQVVTGFIDVQKNVLFYVVCAWMPSGRGYVVEYGTYPDQKRYYFSKSDLSVRLFDVVGSNELAATLWHGLEHLVGDLLARDYEGADGATVQIGKLAVDANWGLSTDIVRRFCRESEFRGSIYPSFGQYLGANSKPWHKMQSAKRDRISLHSRLQPPPKLLGGSKELLIDVNWWKSFVAERLTTPLGSEKSIVLYDDEPYRHQMFAEHCCSEDPTITIGKTGTECVEWKQNPGRPNNDYWDCLVGNAVMAALLGVRLVEATPKMEKAEHPKLKGTAKLRPAPR